MEKSRMESSAAQLRYLLKDWQMALFEISWSDESEAKFKSGPGKLVCKCERTSQIMLVFLC